LFFLFFKEILNLCDSNPCKNGATCETIDNQVYCRCGVGFAGNFCQINVIIGGKQQSGCSTNPCLNGGTCIEETPGTFFCQCVANSYGKTCESRITAETCNAGDVNSNLCQVWSSLKFCDFSFSYNFTPVPIYCPASCNLCKGLSACNDMQPNCQLWAQMGLCDLVNSKDANLCKKSCGTCAPNVLKRRSLDKLKRASKLNKF
jgi:hypothetical protein